MGMFRLLLQLLQSLSPQTMSAQAPCVRDANPRPLGQHSLFPVILPRFKPAHRLVGPPPPTHRDVPSTVRPSHAVTLALPVEKQRLVLVLLTATTAYCPPGRNEGNKKRVEIRIGAVSVAAHPRRTWSCVVPLAPQASWIQPHGMILQPVNTIISLIIQMM